MNGKEPWEKIITTIVGAWVSNQFGLLFPMLCLLMLLMIADYVSGMIAAKRKPWNTLAAKSMAGAVKKVFWEYLKR